MAQIRPLLSVSLLFLLASFATAETRNFTRRTPRKNLTYATSSKKMTTTTVVAPAPTPEVSTPSKFEFGLSAGLPTIGNVHLGLWSPESLPVLVRLSGMYYGKGLYGSELSVGWIFDREGDFKQYLTATTGMTVKGPWDDSHENRTTYWYIGPKYGFRYSVLFLDAGPCYLYQYRHDSLNEDKDGLFFMGQAGFSFHF